MQQEIIKTQNNSKEWNAFSVTIHVAVTSQPQFKNGFEILPTKTFQKENK